MEIPSKADFDLLSEQVSALSRTLESVLAASAVKSVVDVRDIARIEGSSVTDLHHGSAYLLPRFGASAYPTGRARWPVSEYLEWHAVDPAKKLELWRRHLEEVRKRDASSVTRRQKARDA
ncbi:MAG: hypothetical protein WCS71_06305 [Sphaerochaetaceae bacterium]|jgi:hypothetical protein